MTEQINMLSRDIARKIEKEMKYPGQIKISVVRETRDVEHARYHQQDRDGYDPANRPPEPHPEDQRDEDQQRVQ